MSTSKKAKASARKPSVKKAVKSAVTKVKKAVSTPKPKVAKRTPSKKTAAKTPPKVIVRMSPKPEKEKPSLTPGGILGAIQKNIEDGISVITETLLPKPKPDRRKSR